MIILATISTDETFLSKKINLNLSFQKFKNMSCLCYIRISRRQSTASEVWKGVTIFTWFAFSRNSSQMLPQFLCVSCYVKRKKDHIRKWGIKGIQDILEILKQTLQNLENVRENDFLVRLKFFSFAFEKKPLFWLVISLIVLR